MALSRFTLEEFYRADLLREVGKLRSESYNIRASSCGILPPRPGLENVFPGRLRYSLIRVVDNVYFEALILICIALNSFTLAIEKDPLFEGEVGWTQGTEIAFLSLFTVEAVVKILALGFAAHRCAYLRDPWNILDLTIVVIGWGNTIDSGGSFAAVLRSLRLLRPLRTLRTIRKIRVIIGTLARTLPLACNSIALFLFFIWIFALFGIQLYSGSTRYRCYAIVGEQLRLVQNDTYVCGSGYDCDNGLVHPQTCTIDDSQYRGEPMNFDNLLQGVLLAMKVSSLDSWDLDMRRYQQRAGVEVSEIFFIVITIIGGYFSLSVLLAVLEKGFHEERNTPHKPPPCITFLTVPRLLGGSFAHCVLVIGLPCRIVEDISGGGDVLLRDRSLLKLLDVESAQALAEQTTNVHRSVLRKIGAKLIDGVSLTTLEGRRRRMAWRLHKREQEEKGQEGEEDDEAGLCLSEASDESVDYDSDDSRAAAVAIVGSVAKLGRNKRRYCWGVVPDWRPGLLKRAIDTYFKIASPITTLVIWVVVAVDWEEGMTATCYVMYGEVASRLLLTGPETVFRSPFYVWDLILALLTIPWLIHGGVNVSPLRALNILGAVAWLKHFPTLQRVLGCIRHALPTFFYFLLPVLLYVFVFGVLGLHTMNDLTVAGRHIFHTIIQSFLTVFVIFTGTWTSYARAGMDQKGVEYFLYYVACFIVGNVVIMQLLIAILMTCYSQVSMAQDVIESHPPPPVETRNEPVVRQLAARPEPSIATSRTHTTALSSNPDGENNVLLEAQATEELHGIRFYSPGWPTGVREGWVMVEGDFAGNVLKGLLVSVENGRQVPVLQQLGVQLEGQQPLLVVHTKDEVWRYAVPDECLAEVVVALKAMTTAMKNKAVCQSLAQWHVGGSARDIFPDQYWVHSPDEPALCQRFVRENRGQTTPWYKSQSGSTSMVWDEGAWSIIGDGLRVFSLDAPFAPPHTLSAWFDEGSPVAVAFVSVATDNEALFIDCRDGIFAPHAPAVFELDGRRYTSLTHCLQTAKLVREGHRWDAVGKVSNHERAMLLAQKPDGVESESAFSWDTLNEGDDIAVLHRAIRAKHHQDDVAREMLRETGRRPLVCDTPWRFNEGDYTARDYAEGLMKARADLPPDESRDSIMTEHKLDPTLADLLGLPKLGREGARYLTDVLRKDRGSALFTHGVLGEDAKDTKPMLDNDDEEGLQEEVEVVSPGLVLPVGRGAQSLHLQMINTIGANERWRPQSHSLRMNTSLGCRMCGIPGFSTSSGLREKCDKIAAHPLFDMWSLTVAAAQGIMLCVGAPSITDDKAERAVLVTDIMFAIFLFLEMFVRIVSLGFIRARTAYLRDKWNVVEFVATMAAVIGLWVPWIKALRSAKVVRILLWFPSTRLQVEAIAHALPSSLSLVVFIVFFCTVYALLGQQLLKGKLWRCSDPAVTYREQCVGWYRANVTGAFGEEEVVAERVVIVNDRYDSYGKAILATFELASTANWPQAMYEAIDARDSTRSPQHNANPHRAIYFVVFVLMCRVLLVRLLVAIMDDSFQFIKASTKGTYGLTPPQKAWLEAGRLLLIREDVLPGPPPPGKHDDIRRFSLQVVRLPAFEWFITGCIVLNGVILSTAHWQQPDGLKSFQYSLNLFFVSVFTAEMCFKAVALTSRYYWRDRWNRFDAAVVVIGWLGVVGVGASFGSLRLLRVCRLFRLFGRTKWMSTLQVIFDTFLLFIPVVLDILAVLLSIYFCFATLGMVIFGDIEVDPMGSGLNRFTNFRNIHTSMLTLYVVVTGQAWDSVLRDSFDASGRSCSTPSCGVVDEWVSRLYFHTLMVFGGWIALSLLLVNVVEAFRVSISQLQQSGKLDQLQSFISGWKDGDPNGQKIISCPQLLKLLRSLPEPLWRSPISLGMRHCSPVLQALRQLHHMCIPVTSQFLPEAMGMCRARYMDVACSLTLRLYKISREEGLEASQSASCLWPLLDCQQQYVGLQHYVAVQTIERFLRRVTVRKQEMVLSRKLRELRSTVGSLIADRAAALELASRERRQKDIIAKEGQLAIRRLVEEALAHRKQPVEHDDHADDGTTSSEGNAGTDLRSEATYHSDNDNDLWEQGGPPAAGRGGGRLGTPPRHYPPFAHSNSPPPGAPY